MRILHVTDTHLGYEAWFRGAPPGWSRADDHLEAFRLALRPAFQEEVDLVVHSGDLFNRSTPPQICPKQPFDQLLSRSNLDNPPLRHHTDLRAFVLDTFRVTFRVTRNFEPPQRRQ